MLSPPTLDQIIERAERDGRSTVNISIERLRLLVQAEGLLERLAFQTGITENDPRLQRWL